jgi:hypothetical protein
VSLLWPWVCHRTKKNLGQVKDPKNHVPWHVSQDNEINKSRVYESWWSQFYLDLTGYFMGSKYIYIHNHQNKYDIIWLCLKMVVYSDSTLTSFRSQHDSSAQRLSWQRHGPSEKAQLMFSKRDKQRSIQEIEAEMG